MNRAFIWESDCRSVGETLAPLGWTRELLKHDLLVSVKRLKSKMAPSLKRNT